MLRQLNFLWILVTFGHLASSQVVLPGKCPHVNVMTEFDLEAYTGLWYQYSHYPTIFESGLKCIYAKYADIGNSTISVYNGGIDSNTNEDDGISGYAKVLGPATLAVVFFDGQSETEPNYLVLGTDYKTYAVVHSCKKLPLSHGEFLWILTRDRIPSEETIEAAKKVIDDNGLSQSYLVKTQKEDCHPVIDPDNKAYIDNQIKLLKLILRSV